MVFKITTNSKKDTTTAVYSSFSDNELSSEGGESGESDDNDDEQVQEEDESSLDDENHHEQETSSNDNNGSRRKRHNKIRRIHNATNSSDEEEQSSFDSSSSGVIDEIHKQQRHEEQLVVERTGHVDTVAQRQQQHQNHVSHDAAAITVAGTNSSSTTSNTPTSTATTSSSASSTHSSPAILAASPFSWNTIISSRTSNNHIMIRRRTTTDNTTTGPFLDDDQQIDSPTKKMSPFSNSIQQHHQHSSFISPSTMLVAAARGGGLEQQHATHLAQQPASPSSSSSPVVVVVTSLTNDNKIITPSSCSTRVGSTTTPSSSTRRRSSRTTKNGLLYGCCSLLMTKQTRQQQHHLKHLHQSQKHKNQRSNKYNKRNKSCSINTGRWLVSTLKTCLPFFMICIVVLSLLAVLMTHYIIDQLDYYDDSQPMRDRIISSTKSHIRHGHDSSLYHHYHQQPEYDNNNNQTRTLFQKLIQWLLGVSDESYMELPQLIPIRQNPIKQRLSSLSSSSLSLSSSSSSSSLGHYHSRGLMMNPKNDSEALPSECVRPNWQRYQFPTCNDIHELDLAGTILLYKSKTWSSSSLPPQIPVIPTIPSVLVNQENQSSIGGQSVRYYHRHHHPHQQQQQPPPPGYVASGLWRDVWIVHGRQDPTMASPKIITDVSARIEHSAYSGGDSGSWLNLQQPKQVLKTIRLQHEVDLRNLDRHRRDALVMERLTSSPYVVDIYGYCGNSVLTEYIPQSLDDVIHHNGPKLTIQSVTSTKPKGDESFVRQDQALTGDYSISSNSVVKPNRLSSYGRAMLARDVARAVQALHDIPGGPIMHADLQAKQFLVTATGQVKVNDFNRCRFMAYRSRKVLNNNTTTAHAVNEDTWERCPVHIPTAPGKARAPEEYQYKELTEKIDIYSVANIFYEVLTGEKAWDEWSTTEIHQMTAKGAMPAIPKEFMEPFTLDAILANLTMRSYQLNPMDRPSASELAEILEVVTTAHVATQKQDHKNK